MTKRLVATVSSKGQLTLPKPVRELLHIQLGDYIQFEPREGGVLLTRIALEPEGLSESEWKALDHLASKKGKRYKSAKSFLKDLEQL